MESLTQRQQHSPALRASQGNVQQFTLGFRFFCHTQVALGCHHHHTIELQPLGAVHGGQMDHVAGIGMIALRRDGNAPQACGLYQTCDCIPAFFAGCNDAERQRHAINLRGAPLPDEFNGVRCCSLNALDIHNSGYWAV